MDIERTMEFVLENLASVAASQQALAASQKKTDRQIHGLQTVVKTGMRMLVRLEQNVAELAKAQKELSVSQKELSVSQKGLWVAQKELSVAQKELAVQQKRTDQKFERWLDSLQKGLNGHKK